MEGGHLSYYGDEIVFAKGNPPKGTIALAAPAAGSIPQIELLATKGRSHEFLVHTFKGAAGQGEEAERSLLCQAESEADMMRWVHAIEAEIRALNEEESAPEVIEEDPWELELKRHKKWYHHQKSLHADSEEYLDQLQALLAQSKHARAEELRKIQVSSVFRGQGQCRVFGAAGVIACLEEMRRCILFCHLLYLFVYLGSHVSCCLVRDSCSHLMHPYYCDPSHAAPKHQRPRNYE